jgi:hypothetical protein
VSVNARAVKSTYIFFVQSLGPYLNDVSLIFSSPLLSIKILPVNNFFLIFIGVIVIPVAPVNGPYELI